MPRAWNSTLHSTWRSMRLPDLSGPEALAVATRLLGERLYSFLTALSS